MSQRTERVDELLREEIGILLAKEVADPRIGFATITGVETSPDLRHAKVWVSVIGDPRDVKETLRALQQAMGYVRHELGKRLRIRRIPDLHIRLDDTAERGTRVLHLLHELEAGRDPDEIPPIPETLPRPVSRLPHDGDLPDEPPGAGAPELPETPRPRASRRPAARATGATPRGTRGTRGPRRAKP